MNHQTVMFCRYSSSIFGENRDDVFVQYMMFGRSRIDRPVGCQSGFWRRRSEARCRESGLLAARITPRLRHDRDDVGDRKGGPDMARVAGRPV